MVHTPIVSIRVVEVVSVENDMVLVIKLDTTKEDTRMELPIMVDTCNEDTLTVLTSMEEPNKLETRN